MRGLLTVFLPGASLGTWIWDDLATQFAPSKSLPLPGRESEAARRALSLGGAVDALAARLREERAPARIVGHSIGGLLAAGVAARHPDLVARLVLIGSYLPRRGAPFLAHAPLPARLVLRGLFALRPGGMAPPASAMRKELCNGLDEARAERVGREAMPEAPALFTGRVDWDAPRVPTTYVRLLDDRAVTLAAQDASIARLHAPRVVDLPSGHLPMLTHTKELAELIRD